MSPSGLAPGSRAPGRPVNAAIDDQLLRATQDLLIEVGYERLTMDAVAQRCGASKATIYRRWSSKTDLAVAAASHALTTTEVPDTGDLREDLLACGRAYIQSDGRSAELSATLIVASRHDADLRHAAHQVLGDPHVALFRTVILRAVEHGDVSAAVDVDTIVEVFPSIACQRGVTLGKPLDESDVARIVDAVLLPSLRFGKRLSHG
jgi:AcrR family transcriptional regulator